MQATAKWLSYSCSAQNSDLGKKICLEKINSCTAPPIIPTGSNTLQQLAEWTSGLRIGLITARSGFESQGDYCEKNPKITILIENAVSFVVSHPS